MVKGEVRLFDRVTGEAVSGSKLIPGDTPTQPEISKMARLGDIKEPISRGQNLKQEMK